MFVGVLDDEVMGPHFIRGSHEFPLVHNVPRDWGESGGVAVGWGHILRIRRIVLDAHGQCDPQSSQWTSFLRGKTAWLAAPTWSAAHGAWNQLWRQWLPCSPFVSVRGGGARSANQGGCLSSLLCKSSGYRVRGTGRCGRRARRQRRRKPGGTPSDCHRCRCSQARGRHSGKHTLQCQRRMRFLQPHAGRSWISMTLSRVGCWMRGGGPQRERAPMKSARGEMLVLVVTCIVSNRRFLCRESSTRVGYNTARLPRSSPRVWCLYNISFATSKGSPDTAKKQCSGALDSSCSCVLRSGKHSHRMVAGAE